MEIISQTDPVVAAWGAFRSAFAPGSDLTAATDEQRFNNITDAADAVLANTPSTTLAGATGKLRRVFASFNTDQWAERFAIGEDTPENRQQLALADIYTRMLWGAIDDVEHINGACVIAPDGTAFDQALTEFRRLKGIEGGLGRHSTIEEEEKHAPAFEAAIAATDAAFDAMITIPVTDGPRVWAKFAAMLDHYHVGNFGMDEAAQAQVFAEARVALTRTHQGLTRVTPFMTAYETYKQAEAAINAPAGAMTNDEICEVENIYVNALTVIDSTPAADWHEFVKGLEVAWNGDADPHEDLKLKLLADARRLAGEF